MCADERARLLPFVGAPVAREDVWFCAPRDELAWFCVGWGMIWEVTERMDSAGDAARSCLSIKSIKNHESIVESTVRTFFGHRHCVGGALHRLLCVFWAI